MVQGDLIGRGMKAVRVTEQHQAPDDGKQRQGCNPRCMAYPSKSTEQLDAAHRQRQDRVTLMLKNFRIIAEERLHETERTDWPSFMVAPDKEKEACGE
jgi:hypothetical protein